ncbi:MAG: hypothetical protein KDJ38_00205 [Gammaproteobacteria bacterium]|nr:hypothetical protein [Gammaproteobacteria bacterium]
MSRQIKITKDDDGFVVRDVRFFDDEPGFELVAHVGEIKTHEDAAWVAQGFITGGDWQRIDENCWEQRGQVKHTARQQKIGVLIEANKTLSALVTESLSSRLELRVADNLQSEALLEKLIVANAQLTDLLGKSMNLSPGLFDDKTSREHNETNMTHIKTGKGGIER